MVQSSLCMCLNGVLAPEHFLQTCAVYRNLRVKTWARKRSMDGKLWRHTLRTAADEIYGDGSSSCLDG